MLSFLTKLLFCYLALLLLLFIFQRNLIYYPQYGNYDASQIPDEFQEVIIKTSDKIRIKGWLHEKDFSNKKTVLYFHGNAGSINNRLYRIEEFSKMDVNFLIISYRGFSKNEGKPSESGLYDDAESAVAFLENLGVEKNNIVLYGESIGTGVAIEIAQNEGYAGLILEAPYTSIVDIAKKMYPIFPVSVLLRDRFESIDKINNLKSPLLIFHGLNDDLIPIEMGRELFNKASEPKAMIETEDSHSIQFDRNVILKIRQFISKN